MDFLGAKESSIKSLQRAEILIYVLGVMTNEWNELKPSHALYMYY